MNSRGNFNLEMQIILLGDKLRKANYMIVKAMDTTCTKEEIQQILAEVKKIIAEVQDALIG